MSFPLLAIAVFGVDGGYRPSCCCYVDVTPNGIRIHAIRSVVSRCVPIGFLFGMAPHEHEGDEEDNSFHFGSVIRA